MVALIAYLLKSVLHGISTRCSHEATFHVLSELRRAVADKLTHVSMGYLTDTPSGRLKTTMVERVEQMEVPLAHIIPEMTSVGPSRYCGLPLRPGLAYGVSIAYHHPYWDALLYGPDERVSEKIWCGRSSRKAHECHHGGVYQRY